MTLHLLPQTNRPGEAPQKEIGEQGAKHVDLRASLGPGQAPQPLVPSPGRGAIKAVSATGWSWHSCSCEFSRGVGLRSRPENGTRAAEAGAGGPISRKRSPWERTEGSEQSSDGGVYSSSRGAPKMSRGLRKGFPLKRRIVAWPMSRSALATAWASEGRNSPQRLNGRFVTTTVERVRWRAQTTRKRSLAASRPREAATFVIRKSETAWRAGSSSSRT